MRKRPSSIVFLKFWMVVLLLALTEYIPAQTSPQQLNSRLAAGINFYSQGKWSEAVSELRPVQAEASSQELKGEALFWISMSELSAGEYEEALRDMDALEAADPGSRRLAELPYQRGRALYYLGRYNEAIVLLKNYADTLTAGPGGVLSPIDISRKAAALYWTGECLFSMGQLDRAGDVFRLITKDYSGTSKYEASLYRLDLINQKKVEAELLALLKWSHEESLRSMEENRRREASYDQALSAYQKRIAELLKDTRVQDLENLNAQYQEQLNAAQEKILSLENTLRELSSTEGKDTDSVLVERLKTLKTSAQELENTILSFGANSPGDAR